MPTPHELSRRDFFRELGSRQNIGRLAGSIFAGAGGLFGMVAGRADASMEEATRALRQPARRRDGPAAAESPSSLRSSGPDPEPYRENPQPETRLLKLRRKIHGSDT